MSDVKLASTMYNEGKTAAYCGAQQWDNPYCGPDDFTQWFIDWMAGWTAGTKEINE